MSGRSPYTVMIYPMVFHTVSADRMNHDAVEIARYILTYCSRKGRRLDNLQLQKILYFVWVDYYKATGRRLFTDRIEAWHYGPVVPEVYREYSHYVASKIRLFEPVDIIDKDIHIIDKAIENYSCIPVGQLIKRACEVGTPWSRCHSDLSQKVIPICVMERYCDNNDQIIWEFTPNPSL